MQVTTRLISRVIALCCAISATTASAHAQPAPIPAPEPADEPPATPPSEPAATPGPSSSPAAPEPAPLPPPYRAPAYSAPPPGWAPAPVLPPAPTGRSARIGHAHADRVVLLPTAYTHPEGTLYFSSSEIVLLQAGYAVSDTTQITLTGVPPIAEGPDTLYFFDLSLKSAFLRQGPLRLAGIGSVTGLFGVEDANLVLGRVGGVAELCLDRKCESSASLSSHMLLAGPATFMVNGVGAIWRLSDGAALLLEVDTAVPLGGEVGELSGIVVAPGFRFPYRTWSLDLAAVRPLDTEEEPEIAFLPWISFTYRFLP